METFIDIIAQAIRNIPDKYNNNNENLWNTSYRPVAQVAYIWFCRKHKPVPERPIYELDEYKELFDNDGNTKIVEYICDRLNQIDKEFLNRGVQSQDYRFVILKSYNRFLNPSSGSNDEPDKVFLGPSQNDEQSGSRKEQSVVDFLRAHSQDTVSLDIQACDGKMDSKIIEHILHEAQKNSSDFNTLSLTIYTNKDKDKYTYCNRGSLLKLQVNPNPNKWDTTRRRYFYALCPHAAPATAALDYIAAQISPAPGASEYIIIGVQPIILPATPDPRLDQTILVSSMTNNNQTSVQRGTENDNKPIRRSLDDRTEN